MLPLLASQGVSGACSLEWFEDASLCAVMSRDIRGDLDCQLPVWLPRSTWWLPRLLSEPLIRCLEDVCFFSQSQQDAVRSAIFSDVFSTMAFYSDRFVRVWKWLGLCTC